MHSGTSDFIEALTTTMEAYVSYIMSAVYNIFKYMFCEYNASGSITGLNLFGSIVIVLLAITIACVLLRKLLEMVTPWHHEEDFISEGEEEDIIKDPTIISEEEDYKLTHQIYLKERKDKIYGNIKKERLKQYWNIRKSQEEHEKQLRINKLKEHFKNNKNG